MAKKHNVRSLSDGSLGDLANLIVTTIAYAKYATNLDIDNVVVEINQYLETNGATSNIYQDLLRLILGSDYLDASMRYTCLQMLLNCGVSFLVTEVFPFSYYERVLQVIAAQGEGLRVLNLKGIWLKDEHMHYLLEIVKKCKYLTKLFVPYIANDDLLKVVSNHCEYLQILDVSGETDITEIGIEYLSKGICSQRLTVIDIGLAGEENICFSDVAIILENCRNIETLSTYSFVGSALKMIHDSIDKNFTCKLKYLHDTGSNEEIVLIIARTCPHLQSLYLDSPKLGSLRGLSNTFLQKLKIYKFCSVELLSLLENIGETLLHLTIIKNSGDLDLNILARICPSLINLDCYMINGLTYSNSKCSRFTNLEGLEMLNSPMAKMALKYLIYNNPRLKHLAVDNVSFCDDDIVSIFIENDFNQLEDVWFTLAPNLTIQSVEILMERCPELQSVGQLSGWSLNPDDLALVRGLLKSGNSSLVLTPNGIFP